jgi:hypothetical protein
MQDLTNYLTKSREQLQALCADRGYSKAGAKHELIAKLINSDLAQMTENYNSYVKKTKTELTKLFETEANPDSGPKLKEWNDEIVKHKKNLKDGAIQKRGAVKEYIEVMAKRDDTVENNELKAADDTDKRYIVDQFNFETTLLDLLKKKIALNAQQAVVTGSSESHAEVRLRRA